MINTIEDVQVDMKISMKTRYAVKFLKQLALNSEYGERERLSVREVAEKQNISEKYLETIAGELRAAGFITGEKGVNGGYMLRKHPFEIKLGDIMMCTETNYMQKHCMEFPIKTCPNYDSKKRNCPFYCFWDKLQVEMHEFLNKFTLEDVPDNLEMIDKDLSWLAFRYA